MNILILSDRLNWAYHSIAKCIKKYNTDSDLKITILHIKNNIEKIKKVYKKFDRFLVMGWQTYPKVSFLPKKHTLVGIHSHHGWDNKKTTPEKNVNPPKYLVDLLLSFNSVNAVSKRLFDLFSMNGLTNLTYTPNGVDADIFRILNSVRSGSGFTVGYSGTKSHDWRKGITKFILPACKKANCKVKLAMLSTGSYISLDEMPNFYNKIDCYLCASLSEGFSLSVLEAASCGRPIITTRTDGSDELIDDGKNGFLVSRNVNEISEKLIQLKNSQELLNEMSQEIRRSVEEKHHWKLKTNAWIKFMKE